MFGSRQTKLWNRSIYDVTFLQNVQCTFEHFDHCCCCLFSGACVRVCMYVLCDCLCMCVGSYHLSRVEFWVQYAPTLNSYCKWLSIFALCELIDCCIPIQIRIWRWFQLIGIFNCYIVWIKCIDLYMTCCNEPTPWTFWKM